MTTLKFKQSRTGIKSLRVQPLNQETNRQNTDCEPGRFQSPETTQKGDEFSRREANHNIEHNIHLLTAPTLA